MVLKYPFCVESELCLLLEWAPSNPFVIHKLNLVKHVCDAFHKIAGLLLNTPNAQNQSPLPVLRLCHTTVHALSQGQGLLIRQPQHETTLGIH